MASLEYEKIYSRFFTKVSAYDFLTLSDAEVNEFMCNWLHSSIYAPYVRSQFSSLTLDDDMESIEYELSYPLDDYSDEEFVIEVAACGMIYAWISPKVNSITNIVQHFGSTDDKWYSQSAHLSEIRGLRDDMNAAVRSLIRDRGYVYNPYIKQQ